MPEEITLTERIADNITSRALILDRVSAGLQRDVISAFRKLEREIYEEIRAISPVEVGPAYQRARLTKLLQQTRQTIAIHFRAMKIEHSANMLEIGVSTARHLVKTANAAISADLMTVTLGRSQLKSIIENTTIEGAPSADWWSRQERGLHDRFADSVRGGMLRGRTTDEIVHSMQGTRAAAFRDGSFESNRRALKSLVRTSVQHIANEARIEQIKENSDVAKAIKWVSTLDLRTTDICIALDGLTWDAETLEPIDHDKEFPGPTAHWGCRSTQAPVVKDFAALNDGNPIRTENGGRTNAESVFRRNAAAAGLDPSQSVYNARASLDGEVGPKTSFSSWLGRQSKERKETLLGKGRLELFEKKKLSVRQLTDQSNRPLTMAELRRL
jgi:SPP1 gp7 family putative phage head morphogenesis protein